MSFLVGVPGKLKTLLDRLTALRAGYLDYINTLYGIWTSALATAIGTTNTSVATLLSRLTAARAANLDNVGYEFVQRKNDQSMTGATLNITLDTAVVMNRSRVHLTWSVEGSAQWNAVYSGLVVDYIAVDLRPYFPRAKLTSTTNVRIERGAAGSPTVSLLINIEVVEDKAA